MKKHLCMTAILLLSGSLLAAGAAPSPGAVSVVGKWSSEFNTPVGHTKYLYQFKSAGDHLGGTAIRERDGVKTETELKEVVLKDDRLSFIEPTKIQDRDVQIEYRGEVAGDELKLTRTVGEYTPIEIVAHRVAAPAASLDGTWQTEFDSQIGKQKYSYEFKTQGDKLTGKAIGESQFGKFETPITDGKVAPDRVSFVEMLKLPDREIKIEYSGKLDGEVLKLTRKVGDFGTEEIVAKRTHDPAK